MKHSSKSHSGSPGDGSAIDDVISSTEAGPSEQVLKELQNLAENAVELREAQQKELEALHSAALQRVPIVARGYAVDGALQLYHDHVAALQRQLQKSNLLNGQVMLALDVRCKTIRKLKSALAEKQHRAIVSEAVAQESEQCRNLASRSDAAVQVDLLSEAQISFLMQQVASLKIQLIELSQEILASPQHTATAAEDTSTPSRSGMGQRAASSSPCARLPSSSEAAVCSDEHSPSVVQEAARAFTEEISAFVNEVSAHGALELRPPGSDST